MVNVMSHRSLGCSLEARRASAKGAVLKSLACQRAGRRGTAAQPVGPVPGRWKEPPRLPGEAAVRMCL